jgi:hypothetical protein
MVNKNKLHKIQKRLRDMKNEIEMIKNMFYGKTDITKHLRNSEINLLYAESAMKGLSEPQDEKNDQMVEKKV